MPAETPARGSHAPSLLTLARRTLRDEGLLAPGEGVVVAVSGGRDSMALLHVMSLLAPKEGYRVLACGVDHGLRPEAASELDLAEELAEGNGVPFARVAVRLSKGSNLQARAREARFEALESAATEFGAATIATAHHASDRAETFLLRLLQGAGAAGLAVMPPRGAAGSVVRIRPLIRASRATIDAHVARHGLNFADDPSNADARFLRVRVRQELLPLLGSMNPKIVDHLCALADELAPDALRAAERGHIFPLPRATQEALARLRRTRRASARIELPGGLVASVGKTQVHGQRNSDPIGTEPMRGGREAPASEKTKNR